MRDLAKKILLLVFFVLCLVPMSVFAGDKPFGSECTSNSDCKYGDCERSTIEKNGQRKWFCDCTFAQSCADQYNYQGNASDWECKDGMNATYDIDYCRNTKTSYVILPTLPAEYKNLMDHPYGEGIGGTIDAATDLVLDNDAFNKVVGNEIQQMMRKPDLRINIPGLNFTDMQDVPKAQDASGQVYMYIPFIGEYITAVYKYGIALAGLLAVLMLIFAGLEWMIYPEDHSKSSERIQKALTGLVMAVGSYAILYAINPDLVSFKSLRVATVKFVEFSTLNSGEVVSPTDLAGPKEGTNGVPLFKQYEFKNQYGNCGSDITISRSGCGPTSLAMVLKFYGAAVDPVVVANSFATEGYLVCGVGTSWNAMTNSQLLKNNSLKSEIPGSIDKIGNCVVDQEKLIANLKSNQPAVAAVNQDAMGINYKGERTNFTNRGHFIVLTGYDSNDGFITVNDPAKAIVKTLPKDLFLGLRCAWSIHK